MAKHGEGPKYRCPDCGKSFSTALGKALHSCSNPISKPTITPPKK